LRALLAVIEQEMQAIEKDIDGLYENLFIETCDEWVVPYIGDLIGSLRPYVANTLAYRRRKGTVVVLEQLARDVTGWPARAVEFFKLLSVSQHFNHVTLWRGKNLDLHDQNQLELLNGPFENIIFQTLACSYGGFNPIVFREALPDLSLNRTMVAIPLIHLVLTSLFSISLRPKQRLSTWLRR